MTDETIINQALAGRPPMLISVRLVLEHKTKGALRYREVDDIGQVLPIVDAKIGALYVRKSALNGAEPKLIIARISDVG